MKHIKRILILSISIISAVTIMIIPSYGATITIMQGWDLVDSGKHCDIGGSSTYTQLIYDNYGVWNSSYKIVFRKYSSSNVRDVTCLDGGASGQVAATTSPSGTITFRPLMSTLSATQKKNVAIHELGHCLGIAHLYSTDVMYAYVSTRVVLSTNDIASFKEAYKSY